MKRVISLLLALTFVLALAPVVREDVISPVGIIVSLLDLKTVLAVVAVVALVSAVFLWITRKK